MYAIVMIGGKQYLVKSGDIIEVELVKGNEGSEVKFDQVLFYFDGHKMHQGKHALKGYAVKGELLGTVKGPKIESLKYKPTQYRRFGHRQHYSKVKITGIHS